jgi:hypothetical protein
MEVVASVMKKVIAFMREASQLVLFGVSGDLAHKNDPRTLLVPECALADTFSQ